MDWIVQNWLWLALGVGAVFFMSRMGGCGMSHSGGHRQEASARAEPPAAAGPTGLDQSNHQRQTHRHGCC